MGTDIHVVAEVRDATGWHLADVEVPDDRNYWSFAVLANVRNGYGFAGVDTGDAVEPISEPRGLPDDLSPEVRAKLAGDLGPDEYFWLGDHSFSWVTLEELLEYDWDTPLAERGMVSQEQAEEMRRTGKPPTSWCGWTSQPGFVHVQWQHPVREAAWLAQQMMEVLLDLGAPPEDVRLVFGFDS